MKPLLLIVFLLFFMLTKELFCQEYKWFSLNNTNLKYLNLVEYPIEKKVIMLYQSSFGKYPKIIDDESIYDCWDAIVDSMSDSPTDIDTITISTLRKINAAYPEANGITPQVVIGLYDNDSTLLDIHLNKVYYDVTQVPWENAIAVIDYEDWRAGWYTLGIVPDKQKYQRLAKALVRGHYNGLKLTEEEVEKIAKADFQYSAQKFLIKTLEKCRDRRPNSSVQFGYYDYPNRFSTYRWGHESDQIKEMNDELIELWETCDVLLPSIYSYGENDNSLYIEYNIQEAVRISNEHTSSTPVYAFGWYRYHNQSLYSLEFLNQNHVDDMLIIPKEKGARGLIIWGYETVSTCTTEVQDYFDYPLFGKTTKGLGVRILELTPLPVDLQISLNPTGTFYNPKLTWSHNFPGHFDHYEIQRRISNLWITVENNIDPKESQYIDREILIKTKYNSSTVSYRMKIVNNQGNSSSWTPAKSINFYTLLKRDDKFSQDSSYHIPNKFTLFGNYPNPFNSTTKIVFSLPKSSNVKITIFNSVGQKIAVLVNKEFESNRNYIVGWDGTNEFGENVSSGIYFYKFEAGNFTSIKKMLLIR